MKIQTIAARFAMAAIAAVSMMVVSSCTSAASFSAECSSQLPDSTQEGKVSQAYSDVYADFFQDPSEYIIFDIDGNECTEEFFKNTETYFSDSDYDMLYNYIAENAYTLSWITSLDASEEENVHGCNVWYSEIIDLSEISEGEKAEITYAIRCVYTLNKETQKIEQAENATLLSVNVTAEDDLDYLQKGISTPSTTIISSGDSAVFRAKFSLQVNGENSNAPCVFGPFYMQAICDASGECTQSVTWN